MPDIIDKILDKPLPEGKVRPISRRILRLYFLGKTPQEIAKEVGEDREYVWAQLRNPAVQQEIKRLDRLADNIVLRVDVASRRRIKEVALAAVNKLIDKLENGSSNEQFRAAVKLLEWAHGKPRQQFDVAVEAKDEMTDEDRAELDEGLAEKEDVQDKARG